MNTPISLEIAKLLKEKGFNEPCTTIVTKENTHYLVSGVEKTMLNGMLYYTTINQRLPDSMYSAPTIAEVVTWLYKKYGIWTEVYPREFKELNLMWSYTLTKIEYTYTINGVEFPDIEKPDDIPTWKSLIEAYLAAIEYILNNLI